MWCGGPRSTGPRSWAGVDELGGVSAGKLADLLVVDGDPIADIAVLADRTRILAVMKDGQFMKDELAS